MAPWRVTDLVFLLLVLLLLLVFLPVLLGAHRDAAVALLLQLLILRGRACACADLCGVLYLVFQRVPVRTLYCFL